MKILSQILLIFSEAVKWFQEIVANAQCELGDCYYYGKGVTQSYKDAVKWYRLAAERGHARAQCNLGFCYEKGYGVTQSYEDAVKW